MLQFFIVLVLILAFPRLAMLLLAAGVVLAQLAVFGLLIGLAFLILAVVF